MCAGGTPTPAALTQMELSAAISVSSLLMSLVNVALAMTATALTSNRSGNKSSWSLPLTQMGLECTAHTWMLLVMAGGCHPAPKLHMIYVIVRGHV